MERLLFRFFYPIIVVAIVTCGFSVTTSRPLIPGMVGCGLVRGLEDRIDCVARRVGSKMGHSSAASVMRATERRVRGREQFAGVCHKAMHLVAHSRHAHLADQLSKLVLVRGDCVEGLIHGIIESEVTGTSATVLRAARLCGELPPDLREDDCFHGLGHGLRKHQSLRRSTESCASLKHVERDMRYMCLGGAFMEQAWRGAKTRTTHAMIADCTALPRSDAALACWEYVPQRIVGESRTFDRGRRACMRAPTPLYRHHCLAYLGDTQGTKSLKGCGRLPSDEDFLYCFDGYVHRAAFVTHAISTRRAARNCLKSASVHRRYRTMCARLIGWQIQRSRDFDVGAPSCLAVLPVVLTNKCEDARDKAASEAPERNLFGV